MVHFIFNLRVLIMILVRYLKVWICDQSVLNPLLDVIAFHVTLVASSEVACSLSFTLSFLDFSYFIHILIHSIIYVVLLFLNTSLPFMKYCVSSFISILPSYKFHLLKLVVPQTYYLKFTTNGLSFIYRTEYIVKMKKVL